MYFAFDSHLQIQTSSLSIQPSDQTDVSSEVDKQTAVDCESSSQEEKGGFRLLRPHECGHCDGAFALLTSLNTHSAAVHGVTTPDRGKGDNCLNTHSTAVHGVKPRDRSKEDDCPSVHSSADQRAESCHTAIAMETAENGDPISDQGVRVPERSDAQTGSLDTHQVRD